MSNEDGPGDTLSPSESLDPDDLKNDGDNDVVDPPEDWAEADKFGTTHSEEREGESLDDRVAEEVPDTPLEEQPEVPVAASPDDQLTEELVDEVVDDLGPDDNVLADGVQELESDNGLVVHDASARMPHRGDGGTSDGESLFPVVD
jgi:hypothetical protein